MRLHHLEIQGIGPFPDRQRIDFADLDAAGLFLLDGPTGAGKSTVLAAICYALYGTLPGSRKLDSLPSTLAGPDVQPEVQLEVTISGRCFEILRWPAHQRPAKRRRAGSTGMVTEQAGVHLRELVEGDWVERSRRNDEAGQLLGEVLGLTSEQFMRVVLLPQGEFAAFLQAGSKEREALLRKLFGTQRFDAVEDWLRDEARKHGAQVQHDADALSSLREDLQSQLTLLKTEEEEAEAEVSTEVYDDALIHQLRTGLDAEVNAARAGQDHEQQRLAQQRRQHEQLVTHQRQRNAAAAWAARYRAHTAQRETIAAGRAALERHQAAAPVITADHHRRSAARTLDDARSELKVTIDQALNNPRVVDWHAESDSNAEADQQHDWSVIATRAARAVDRLEYHRMDESKLSELTQQTAQAAEQITQQDQHLQHVQQQLDQLAQRREQLNTTLTELTAEPVNLDQSRQQVAEAEKRVAAARQAHTDEKSLLQAQQKLRAAVDAHQKTTDRWQQLMKQRLDHAAALLAAELSPETPCPVCGADEHPAPADTGVPEEISQAGLDTAEEHREEAETARSAAQSAVDEARSRLDTSRTASAGVTQDEAQRYLDTAQQQLTGAEKTTQSIEQTRLQVEDANTEHERLRTEYQQTEQTLAGLRSTWRSRDDERVTIQKRLEAVLTGYASVAELGHEVIAAQDKVTAVSQRLRDVELAEHGLTQSEQALSEALSSSATEDHGAFATVEQAGIARLPEDDAAVNLQRVRAYDSEAAALDERAAAEDVVAGRELIEENAATDETAEADEMSAQIRTTAEAVREAEQRASEASARLGASATRRDHVLAQIEKMQQIINRSSARVARFEELDQLLKLVRGEAENSYRMRLGSYVLAGRLEKVALAASERLAGMTQGRYTIEHDDTAVSGRRAGLDLRIRDHVNDTLRHPSTLSGGESFMASLALALGLADTVQAEAGGITMDTLFVDEGFGSLDAQTLEQVMEVLDGLQASGRTIGLVSHVEAMKHQIPHRVEVTKNSAGSTVRVVGPSGVLSG